MNAARRLLHRRHPTVLAALLAALLCGACAVPGTPGAPAQADSAAQAAGTSSAGTDGQSPQASDDAAAHRAAAEAEAAEPGGALPGENLPQVELSQKLLFQLLAAEVAAQRGQIADASATYLAMARETRDPRLARRAAELALGNRSLQTALSAAQLWHELSPDSPMATQTIEALWLTTGRLDSAEPLLRARLERARTDKQLTQAYAYIQRALARSPDRSASLALICGSNPAMNRPPSPPRNTPRRPKMARRARSNNCRPSSSASRRRWKRASCWRGYWLPASAPTKRARSSRQHSSRNPTAR